MTQGAYIFDCDGPRLSANEKAFFRDADPFGFILFARHIETPDQVRALCAELRDCVGRDALITIDQEGGRVQRLRGPEWREWLPPLDHVERAGAGAERAMYLRYRLIAHELRDLGIDSNCAPMVDVAHDNTHDFLKNRCYGYDAANVIRMGRAVGQGMLDGGVLPVLKHIPGHGRALVDSHFDLPCVDTPLAELMDTDFAPFKALNDLPMGMTAHIVYSGIDDTPATTSPKTMQMIRNVIGFDNLIMTDDICMKALPGGLAERCMASLAAGCDVILHCNDTLREKVIVTDASGRMGKEAQKRADRAIAMRKTPDEVDISALEAELEVLLNAGP